MFEKSSQQSARPTLWEILPKAFFKHALMQNITLSLNLLNKTNILILEFFCIVQEVEAASAKMNKLQVIQKIKEDQKTKEEKKCLKKGKNF